MKFSIIGGVMAVVLALGAATAFAQSTTTSFGTGMLREQTPPPAIYGQDSASSASSNKSQSGQYTQGNSQSLMPTSTQGQAEQTGSTPAKSQ